MIELVKKKKKHKAGDRWRSDRGEEDVIILAYIDTMDKGKVVASGAATMANKRGTASPALARNRCNPLAYVSARQIDDKINFSRHLVDARFDHAENLFRKDLYSHYGCINAIEFSKDGELLVSGGDDKRVLLWKINQAVQEHGKPIVMKAQHMSNIFCLGYNNSRTKIFSAGNDDQVIVHDLDTTDVLNFFRHEKPVYGLSVHPHNDNVFASACDDGRVLIYDIRGSASSAESYFCLAQHKNPFHSVMFNPVDPVTLATANAKEGVSMWDVRKPLKPVLRYGTDGYAQSCMNVTFNKDGTMILALRRRLPPVLYAVNSPEHICQFDHPGYYNSCTMKSCCYAGNNDEYVLSGSDDFNLYMWKIPTDENVKWVDNAHMILRGHRSIVNQVRYNQASCVLASSGVEKIIKLWSPFTLGAKCLGGLQKSDDREEKQRRVYTHDEYIGLVLRSNQLMTHDYSQQSMEEDQRMMAFFDSLVQREIESWSSEDIPTPQSPSDPGNNNDSDSNNQTDSDDSNAPSERQLSRCFVSSTLNSHAPSTTTERPLESANRITRLIANRREKLMRLALEGNRSQAKNNNANGSSNSQTNATGANAVNSASNSEPENNNFARNNKSKASKIMLRAKGVKRKLSSRVSARRNRVRRKQNNAKDDSDSESEAKPSTRTSQAKSNCQQSADGAQPSTSSGVISTRRSRYNSAPLVKQAKNRRSRSSSLSSSASDDNTKPTENGVRSNTRRSVKSDSDSSVKELPKRKTCRNKSKITPTTSAMTTRRTVENSRIKSKRQKVNCEEAYKQHNGNSKEMTPKKNLRLSSDSGITSGVSTVEKGNASTVEKLRTRAASSDRERACKNLEKFKKKVEVARRGYRKRIMIQSPSSSDSSDD